MDISKLLLGKLPPRIDQRTIKLSSLIKPGLLPPLPTEYDIDSKTGLIDNNQYANDKYGDCVIAARAHMTLRFEMTEQARELVITDNEVIAEYMEEGNNEANGPGLIILDSLNKWRQDGWMVGGQNYKIHAFSSVDWKNHDEVKYCIYLLNGIYTGLALPSTAATQIQNKQPWDVINPGSPEAKPGSWGYHAVYGKAYNSDNPQPAPSRCKVGNGIAKGLNLVQGVRGRRGRFYYLNPQVKYLVGGYNAVGPIVVTWGMNQQTTWAWWDSYVDEAYGIIDEKDPWLGSNSPIDSDQLETTLKEITQ